MRRDEPAGPIAAATATLLGWLSAAGIPAQLAPPGDDAGPGSPGDDAGPGGVCCWPVALLPEQATRNASGHGPLRLRVRYLITANAPADALTDLLDQFLLASLAESTVHLAIEPVTVDTWRAFGRSPRLGLYAEVPAQVARPRPTPPRVRAPLQLDSRPLGRVHGTVVGPAGVPVPGIRVVAVATGAATYTDNRGQFAFPAFPAGGPVRLQLSGRGLDLVAEVTGQSDEPIVIHCAMEEV